MKEEIPGLKLAFAGRENFAYTLARSALYEKKENHKNDVSHMHDAIEIYVNVKGSVSFVVGSVVYPVQRGDAIISLPNEFHHCIYRSDGIHEHYCLWVTGLPDGFTARLCGAKGEGNLISMKEDDKEKLLFLLGVMDAEKSNGIPDNAELSALFGIFDLLGQNGGMSVKPAALPELLGRITGYINARFAEDCSEKTLCDKFFISRSTLLRLFAKYLGVTPSKYLLSLRLSEAKSRLEKGESVQSVCYACGFSDYSHFIATFKKRFGITPYRYTRSLQ